MNKLFSKVAALSVGLAMAIGVGVALGSQKESKTVKAAKYNAYTLDGTVVTSGTDDAKYDTVSEVTQSGLTWHVTGNTTMNPWRIGGKGESGKVTKTYDRVISSQAAVSSESITEVVVSIGTKSSSNFVVNSFVMTVSTEVDGGGTVESSLSGTVTANTAITFALPEGKDWSSKFFTFNANVSCTGTASSASNVYFQLTSIAFNYEASVLEPDTVEVSGDNAVSVGSSIQLTSVAKKEGSSSGVNQNVVWSSSNEAAAKVGQDGLVTGVGNGTSTIRATAENDETIYGELAVSVTGGKTNDVALVITPSDVPAAYGDNYSVIAGVYTHLKQVMLGSNTIQIQRNNGLVENVAALPYDISKIEISFNAEKTQGTGFAIKASTDGETFVSLEAEQVYANRFAYSAPSTGYRFFQVTAPTSGTLYLDEILVGLGNADEVKLLTLATALNDLLDAECTGSGDTSPITAQKWSEVQAAYDGGDADAKAALAAVDSLSYIEVNQFLSRYDYIVGTYGYTNFLSRDVSASSSVRGYFELDSAANNNTMIIIIAVAAVSAVALGTLLILKKKKHN